MRRSYLLVGLCVVNVTWLAVCQSAQAETASSSFKALLPTPIDSETPALSKLDRSATSIAEWLSQSPDSNSPSLDQIIGIQLNSTESGLDLILNTAEGQLPLELIALQLAQLNERQPRSLSSISLKPDDIDRIHLARDILIRDLDHPPSLLSLAKQSRINSFKLKKGFRQVFNTTVFGYLHAYRMEEASLYRAAGECFSSLGSNSQMD